MRMLHGLMVTPLSVFVTTYRVCKLIRLALAQELAHGPMGGGGGGGGGGLFIAFWYKDTCWIELKSCQLRNVN